ncbi:ABC transporter permease subunit [Agrobacterium vitis]|uniref:ABC transporter permease subunit n=1 Tax=Agrobacterium vitis TaxID=373 RepID=A0ABD6GFI9_AGRVI|nr:ABC transporter permease subunit [Agrobacterium vitis]MUO78702.1 ABC transporter permease subunit [Agrobacterium vitis]MUO95095.1 ABC transporter permease subunit [Agrobacterium vitis]MUP05114.1 ABC transporter permease subunit [Agrobacterium vitis]MUZ81860.1 ABC transporter permease subunit [Agrobacterium vitis]MVA09592.1 ABC transporter permease subunit [Agrobacterium vitis]
MIHPKFAPLAIRRSHLPNHWDLMALLLIIGVIVLFAYGERVTTVPLSVLDAAPMSLDPTNLPIYALRTILRMLAAILFSLVFTLIYASVAAKSRRAEMVMIPVLDILQSVPILGFLTFTVTFFLNLFPGRVIGAELASVFAIFTSQAWNMTFSMYQSMRSQPKDLEEATRSFQLSGWQRFWRLDVPFAMPGLVWNTMMSMSGGWFFVVASEAITVGNTTITLPGIGSYVALAIKQQDILAVFYAVIAMLAIILLYDQLMFRPLVAWADKFRFETTASGVAPSSWMLDLFRKARVTRLLVAPLNWLARQVWTLRLPKLPSLGSKVASPATSRAIDWIWIAIIAGMAAWAAYISFDYLRASIGWSEIPTVILYGSITLLRVIVLMAIATLVWVPVGVWIGLRPKLSEKVQPLAQFLAAFPANIAFPVFVVVIVHFGLNADIWLSPLMILGTQWYILFNVIAGASAFPSDLKEAARSFHITGWRWWFKVILPGIFPYYITGAITASGGSWNASIVAEVASWGDTQLTTPGLGSYIANATTAGDFPRVVLGIIVMCTFVTLFNRLVWRPLYAYGESRLRLG